MRGWEQFVSTPPNRPNLNTISAKRLLGWLKRRDAVGNKVLASVLAWMGLSSTGAISV
jgi:hypothetical protein